MEKIKCPYCGGEADAEFVDIGVGFQQVTAAACPTCHASQINPYEEPKELTEEEKRTGWHGPDPDWNK